MAKRKIKRIMENGRSIALQKGETRRKDGIYLYYYYDDNHKRKCLTSTTLNGLREKEANLNKDKVNNIRIDKNRLTLNEVHSEWRKSIIVKRTTASNYDWVYNAYAKGKFGKKVMKDITEIDVTQLYLHLLDERHLAVATVDNLQTVIQEVFNYAVKKKYIYENVCVGIMKKIKEKYDKEKDVSAFTQAEQARFLSYMKEYDEKNKSNWYPMFSTMLFTGLRIGELTGLQWEDITISDSGDSGTMSIIHNHVYYKDREMDLMVHSIHMPKTKAGKRTFALSEPAIESILMQKELGKKYTGEPIDGYSNFVFVNRDGNVYHQQDINRAIKRIITYANLDAEERNKNGEDIVIIPPVSSHTFRRTFITRCAEAGMNIKVVMKTVGHSDIRTTTEIYTNVGEDWEKDEIKKMNAHLKDKVL